MRCLYMIVRISRHQSLFLKVIDRLTAGSYAESESTSSLLKENVIS